MEFQGILLDNQKEWSKKIDEKQAEMSKIREQHQKAEEDIKQMMYVSLYSISFIHVRKQDSSSKRVQHHLKGTQFEPKISEFYFSFYLSQSESSEIFSHLN